MTESENPIEETPSGEENAPLKDPPGGGEGADETPKDSERVARRAFFVEGFRNLLKPVADLLEYRLDHIRHTIEESQRAAGLDSYRIPPHRETQEPYMEPEASRILRPPGALEEELFLDRCATSGECVEVCPVQAIQVSDSEDARLNGTPYIDPRMQACVVCDDLACMQACPSGALQKVPRHLIQIGVAEVRHDICLRSEGEDCQICVDKCPIGPEAILVPQVEASVEVKVEGCVGCAICEMYCPTDPRAIVVRPS